MVRTRAGAIGLLVVATALPGGCAPSPSGTASTAVGGTRPPLEATPATGPATVVPSAWGPIWDAVPPEFLVFAGAQPVEIAEPVSAALDHPAQAASPEAIAQAYLTDLAVGGWRTAMGTPLEDGGAVVEAVRDGTACRAQVRARPLGGVVRITVLYGADCPSP